MNKKTQFLLIALLLLFLLTGCTSKKEKEFKAIYNADNEIVSYKSVDSTKTVITVGNYYETELLPIEEAIEAKFPNVDIVVMPAAAGQTSTIYWEEQRKNGDICDINFLSSMDYGVDSGIYDLSSESFIERYNLTAINEFSVDGHIYQIPLFSTLFGIFYNKTLFEEKGWEVPKTIDEFYTLCETIEKAGITPFAACLKYPTTTQNVGYGFSYDDMFSTAEKSVKFSKYASGEISPEGIIEPYLNELKLLYEKGILQDSDYTASATKQRQALYAGSVAMVPYDTRFITMYNDEKPDCEIGLFGYPTKTENDRYLRMEMNGSICLSEKSMGNKEKKQVLLDIFDYLSTNDGQDVLAKVFSGISSLKTYQGELGTQYEEIGDCMKNSRVYFADYFNGDNNFVHEFMKGEKTLEETVEHLDSRRTGEVSASSDTNYDVIGQATETFTILDTSIYNAEVLRNATGANIALMPNLCYYKGNLGKIYKGDIILPSRFYLKSISAKDYLTVYKITGANLKLLMEYPIINGKEVDILYAFSGLKVSFAPWRESSKNIVSITLADGSEIVDDAYYSVAAWATTIDEKYISEVIQTFPDIASNEALMEKTIKEAGSISPIKDGRLTLIWD